MSWRDLNPAEVGKRESPIERCAGEAREGMEMGDDCGAWHGEVRDGVWCAMVHGFGAYHLAGADPPAFLRSAAASPGVLGARV